MAIIAIILVFIGIACIAAMIAGLIKPSILTDPKTGIVPSRQKIVAGFGVLVLFFGVMALVLMPESVPSHEEAKSQTANNSPPKSVKPAAPKGGPKQIRPETIVTFPKGEIACLTEDALQEAFLNGASGKATKMRSLFTDGSGGAGQCIMLDPKQSYRVIDAHYNDPDMPEAAIFEVVGEDITASDQGAFVLVIGNSMFHIEEEPNE